MGPVKNEDVAIALLRTSEGVRVVLEASRIAVGDQNNYGFEIHGTKGLVRWDFRRMGELELGYGDIYANQMLQTVYVGPGQGEFGAFQPGAAISMGYDDTKVIEAARFLESIASGSHRGSQVRDAAIAADVVAAMITSAATHAWVTI
jgi:predicted dehydrogenase